MSSPAPDNKSALEFLRLWAPGGPWVLTAIKTDRKSIDTQTFTGDDEERLLEWLREYNGSRNIYFHVNPTINAVTKKADREDIKSLSWLHVDIDPRAGEDIEEERRRALGLLTDRLPEGVPEPTCIVFSGGGYQAFWRLADPIEINGNLELAEEAKLYNLQLELLFGADNCHNIDRIMRLPGTINIPDARKIKKGRVPELATVVEFRTGDEATYELSRFSKAAPVQSPGDAGFGGGGAKPIVEVSGNIERVQDLSELDEWSVPDRVKIIIAQGRHPEEVKPGDNSRSAWLFDVCCNLARCGVPDNVIYSILTDPEWGISESVLELKSNAQKYALRQIERGKEHAIDPALEALNARHAVIETIGGKCRVAEEVMDDTLGRPKLQLQSFEDFRNRYMNDEVQIGVDANGVPKFMEKGKWWLKHQRRRQFRTVTFAPGREVGDSYNMWKGFACESRPGDCSLLLEHVRENICSGNEEHYNYLLGWMARMVQHPDRQGEVAIVMRGGRGTGKSFFAQQLGSLMGRHFLAVSNSSHLTGNFNAHLRDLVLLFGDEAFYANDKKHASILKTLITEPTLTIERKGVDVENAPNFIHLIMASNDMHVIPAGGDERRYFVLDVGEEHKQDTGYFRRIAEQMDNGGREALLNMLLNHDISDFEVRRVPRTAALHEQKLLSLDPDHEWWYQKLLDGQVLRDQDGWTTEVVKDQLVDDYVEHTRRFNVQRRGNQTALGRFLSKVCPGLDQVKRIAKIEVPTGDGYTRTVQRRVLHYQLPTLEEARAHWERMHGQEDWPEVEAQEELGSSETPF